MSSDKTRERVQRARARRMGATLQRDGQLLRVLSSGGQCLCVGTFDAVEAWLIEHAPRRPPGLPRDAVPPRWRRWVELFVDEQQAAKRSPGTIRTRVGHLVALAKARPDLGPLDVQRADLITYMAAQNWEPRMAHSVRATLRVFFRMLVDLEHRTTAPARTLPSVRLPRSMPRPCPDHVVQQAYSQIANDRLRLAVRIMVETGMRRAEVAGLHTGDLEGCAGDFRLHVVGKGGHERTVPITDDLAVVIIDQPAGYLFPSVGGLAPITARHLGKLIAEALPDHWTAHTLRHRFATSAYKATGDLRAVQELLGHTSPVTTAIYTKVSDDAMRRAALASHLNLG